MARWAADRAIDRISDRFGWDGIGYGSVALGISRSVPDEFRELADDRRNSAASAVLSPRRPQRNRSELGETTVNKTWRKHLSQP
jgi:hypothetical protein